MNYIKLQSEKFQLLFEIGVCAISDGYFREAVLSFSSSLERLYEFSLKCFAYKHGITTAEFQNSWKNMRNYSERQLGAFLFSWQLETGITAGPIHDSVMQLRNRVAHQGEIPSMEGAVAHGETIYYYILEKLKYLRANYADVIQGIMVESNFDQDFNSLGEMHSRSVVAFPFLIRIDSEPRKESFREILSKIPASVRLSARF